MLTLILSLPPTATMSKHSDEMADLEMLRLVTYCSVVGLVALVIAQRKDGTGDNTVTGRPTIRVETHPALLSYDAVVGSSGHPGLRGGRSIPRVARCRTY